MAFSPDALSRLPEADVARMSASILNFYDYARPPSSIDEAYAYWNDEVHPYFERRGYVGRHFDHLRHQGVTLARALLQELHTPQPDDF